MNHELCHRRLTPAAELSSQLQTFAVGLFLLPSLVLLRPRKKGMRLDVKQRLRGSPHNEAKGSAPYPRNLEKLVPVHHSQRLLSFVRTKMETTLFALQ